MTGRPRHRSYGDPAEPRARPSARDIWTQCFLDSFTVLLVALVAAGLIVLSDTWDTTGSVLPHIP